MISYIRSQWFKLSKVLGNAREGDNTIIGALGGSQS